MKAGDFTCNLISTLSPDNRVVLLKIEGSLTYNTRDWLLNDESILASVNSQRI